MRAASVQITGSEWGNIILALHRDAREANRAGTLATEWRSAAGAHLYEHAAELHALADRLSAAELHVGSTEVVRK